MKILARLRKELWLLVVGCRATPLAKLDPGRDHRPGRRAPNSRRPGGRRTDSYPVPLELPHSALGSLDGGRERPAGECRSSEGG